MNGPRLSHSAALILKTLSLGYCFGLDVMEATGLPSGTVYPALRRLERDGLVESKWEPEDEAAANRRPARRYYEVTVAGREAATAATARYPLLARLVLGEAPMRSAGAWRTGLAARLQGFEATLLRLAARLVPAGERAEWLRGWQAELWDMHDRGLRARRGGCTALVDFYVGLVLDALWLRGEAWRRRLQGTPVLCLGFLLGLNLLALLPALVLWLWSGAGWEMRGAELERSLLASPLILFVAFAVAPRRHSEDGGVRRGRRWLRRQMFFGIKASLVLLLMFLLSGNVLEPVAVKAPNVADFLQIFCFVLFALLGLRWAILDQDGRCKQCLHLLAMPAQVGRPSHNLLEWNGVAMVCKRGHGRLHVPELETSWDASGRWVDVEVC